MKEGDRVRAIRGFPGQTGTVLSVSSPDPKVPEHLGRGAFLTVRFDKRKIVTCMPEDHFEALSTRTQYCSFCKHSLEDCQCDTLQICQVCAHRLSHCVCAKEEEQCSSS